jgi:YesN/AraC family two-component response regulator
MELVKHRFILGLDHTIHQRLLEDIVSTNVNYPDELSERLIKAIRLNKKDEFEYILHDIIELLKGFPYSKSISMLFQVITECIKTINQTSQQDSKKYYLGLDDINTIFSSLETLEQAEEWLKNIFYNYQDMMDKINLLKSNKHYHLVEKMQNYIKQNFKDYNMNVESLADLSGYTSYYFSKIFKDITGLAVTDYIRQVRINTAKELLSIDEIKISDISSIIGFSNPSYFYSIFKKDVGLTPSAYKEYILSKTTSTK